MCACKRSLPHLSREPHESLVSKVGLAPCPGSCPFLCFSCTPALLASSFSSPVFGVNFDPAVVSKMWIKGGDVSDGGVRIAGESSRYRIY